MKRLIFILFISCSSNKENSTNSLNSYKYSDIHINSQKGGYYKVKDLLKEDKNRVDALNYNDDTPLILAVTYNRFKTIKLLIENNSDLDFQNKSGINALLIAVEHSNDKVAKYLLDKNSNVNIQDNKGFSSLMIAIINEDLAMVKLLLQYGADVNIIKNKDLLTSYKLALIIANKMIIKELEENNIKETLILIKDTVIIDGKLDKNIKKGDLITFKGNTIFLNYKKYKNIKTLKGGFFIKQKNGYEYKTNKNSTLKLKNGKIFIDNGY